MSDSSRNAWLFWASVMDDPPPLAFIEMLMASMRSHPETPCLLAGHGRLLYLNECFGGSDVVFDNYRPVTLSGAAVFALKRAARQVDIAVPQANAIREWGAR